VRVCGVEEGETTTVSQRDSKHENGPENANVRATRAFRARARKKKKKSGGDAE
jgi:hypothetical protein